MRDRLTALASARPPQGTGGLMAATLVLSIGKGTFLSTVMIYLLQTAQLGTLVASAALSLWGAASVAVAFPVGVLIDRGRGREAGALSAVVAAVLIPLTAQVHTPWLLMVVLCAAGGFDSTGNVVRRALIAGAAGSGVQGLAWARTVTNIGFALGALVSVRLLAAGSASGYRWTYGVIGGVYLLMAMCFLLTSLGRRRPAKAATAAADPSNRADQAAANKADAARPDGRRGRSGALLALSTAVLTVHTTLLTTVLPLWITEHTDVPVSAMGWLFMTNTVITISGQIAVSRRAATSEGALRCFRGSAFWTGGCCVLLAAVSHVPTAVQAVLLVAATIALTVGELLEAAGEWGLSATLAAEGEHGFYQSACVVGEATQSAIGPLLVGALLTALPVAGWVLLMGAIGTGRCVAGQVLPGGRRAPAREPTPI
ncbi:MFS transporter [Streptomyces sp. LP05-1]|uniref:MFS transporter n=1 Tax=Streptomyces pyxinae TaxID=2970734 RepID=A0ABT2CQS2_9ACTN|nr:MFS transporter [Streptomyces sp. LP05-1]MCS0639789.1 MFS transporter [Streptomyces sp. LP05-1]